MIRKALLACSAALAVLSSVSCGKGRVPVAVAGETDVKVFVSQERVEVRSGPSADASRAGALARGAELRLKGYTAGFGHVVLPSGGEGWIPAGSFERLADRQARLARTADVAKLPPQPGRALEPVPFFLAPDFGAAQYGGCEEGAELTVLLADHDFYGVLLPGKTLAFVPARSVRLLPGPPEAPPPPSEAPPAVGGAGVHVAAGGHPPGDMAQKAPSPPGAPPPPEQVRTAPYDALPSDAEPPVLVTRVDPRYPEFARRAGMSGDVSLRVLVDAEGRVSRVEVVVPAPGGMTEAATDAVRRWVYQPARIGGRPVSVWKVVRVHFAIDGKPTRSDELPPL